MSLKLEFANVRGLGELNQRRMAKYRFEQNTIDIAVYTETKSKPGAEAEWGYQFPPKQSFYSHFVEGQEARPARGEQLGPRKPRAGVLIWWKRTVKVLQKLEIVSGRAAAIQAEVKSGQYWIFGLYAPNTPSERRAFFLEVQSKVMELGISGNVLMGGDVNCVISESDRIGASSNWSMDSGTTELTQIMASLSLKDVWKHGD